MTYLYNNDRVYNFSLNVHNNQAYHENMNMVIKNIEQWNHLLIRKDTGRELPEDSPGVQLEVAEIKRYIKELQHKLYFMKFLPESSWKNKGIFVTLYLWLYQKVLHVLAKPFKEVQKLEGKLATGINYVPCELIETLQKQHKQKTKLKILSEEAKLLKIMAEQTKGAEDKERATRKVREKEEQFRVKLEKFGKIRKKARTQSAFKVVGPMLIGLLLRYCYSAVDAMCFFFMILAQCTYGNVLSLVYVVFLFGYALVVRCRPHRWYWKFMQAYSGVVIILKVVCGNMATFITKYVCKPDTQCPVLKMFESLQVNVSPLTATCNNNPIVRDPTGAVRGGQAGLHYAAAV